MYITGIQGGFPTMAGNSGKHGRRRGGSRQNGSSSTRDDRVQISDAARELANANEPPSDRATNEG